MSQSNPLMGEGARLRVGGLTQLTTIDYPGELAAVIYCQGCPFRCSYCHNAHLVTAKGDLSIAWSEVLQFLRGRHGLLDAVVFSGGEPTLQWALGSAMGEVKALGYKIGLHTAGPYPRRLKRILPLVDWVGLDIKALPADYEAVTGVPGSGRGCWESLDLLLKSGVPLDVRTTPMPGRHTAPYMESLTHRLGQAGVSKHRIQTCRTERMLSNSPISDGHSKSSALSA